MKTISDLASEFMKQNFNDSIGINYTPFAIMLYLKEHNFTLTNHCFDLLVRFIYRFYYDNYEYSIVNSNVLISHIKHYCVDDFKNYVSDQLLLWVKNGSGVLEFDNSKIFLNINVISSKDLLILNKLIDTISIKNFNKVITYTTSIESIIWQVDLSQMDFSNYCDLINSTKFKNRGFEDANYCMCCDEINYDNLQVIHLDFNKNLDDPNNSIVLCKKHAKLYFYKYFKFDKKGRIVILKEHDDLDYRMRINYTIVKNKEMYLGE